MAQNLAALLLELKPLLADTRKHWAQIVDLLEQHGELAEFEVARWFAASAMEAGLTDALQSIDPRERLRAVDAVALTFGSSSAAKWLRRLVKDPDPRVRARAGRAASNLGVPDVALRDTRFELKQPKQFMGNWNWTGWSFGIHKNNLGWYPAPKQPTNFGTLAQRGLPAIADAAGLAALLQIDGGADGLKKLMRPGVGKGAPYVEFEIAKAKGGTRRIAAPRAPLRAAQRAILELILNKVAMHPAAHGFVTGRSTVTNARPHLGAAIVVKLDLKDFFPTVHYRRVLGLYEWLGYSRDVAALLAGLTTHRPVLADGRVAWPGLLPQGAPTSPALANLSCRRLDARLAGLAKRAGAVYTRYADDLTFSFPKAAGEPKGGVGRLLWWVDQVCQQEGFVENAGKRRVLRAKSQQRVTGIVVNQGLHVPRAARRTFRAILANCKKHGVASQARDHEDFGAYLTGFAAYVNMVEPALGAKLIAEVDALLAKGS